jgi:hypothetical protein
MAINQNIFGYMPADSIDWAKQMNSLSGTISGIGERREKEKEYLDQLKTDNIKTIQTSDAFASQNFGQMMLASSQEGVGTIKVWNDALKRGELDPKQYKQNMNNLMESWGTLGNSIKSFDAKNAELQKRLQDGTASKASVEAAEYFARMGDIKNMKVFIDPSTGTVSTGRLDPRTGQVIPDTIESAKTMADPSNAVFDKVELDKAVNETTKLWKDYVTENGVTTLTDLTRRPGFANKLADLTGALTSNNRMTMSILQDNMDEGYTTYYTSLDRNQILMGMVQKENESRRYQDLPELSGEDFESFLQEAEKKLIPMQKDASGVYQPMISEEQRDRAKGSIEASVEMQLGFKSLQDEPKAPTGGGGGGSSTVKAEDKPEYYKTAADVRTAWINGDVNALSSLSGGKYLFEKKGENTYLVINASNPKDVKGPFYKLDDVGSFFGVSNRDTWTKKMGKARSAANNQQTQQPKMTQEQWNTKWATLKKGETMVGLDGVTYTKK